MGIIKNKIPGTPIRSVTITDEFADIADSMDFSIYDDEHCIVNFFPIKK